MYFFPVEKVLQNKFTNKYTPKTENKLA